MRAARWPLPPRLTPSPDHDALRNGMIIHREQKTALAERQRRAQCDLARDYLRAELRDLVADLGDDALFEHCRESMEIGLAFGLSDHRSVVWLAAMRVLIHPRFHEHPRLRALLADPRVPPEARIDHVLAEATELDFHEAAIVGPGIPLAEP